MLRKIRLFLLLLAFCLCICACTGKKENEKKDQTGFVLPDDIRVNPAGVPQLRVYVKEDQQIHEMDLEEYLQGVLAGEMKNDWPEEALRAQAILARTFVVRFITEKHSQYDGADISTDIEEAQAYNADGINDRIRDAVDATRGEIAVYQDEPIYAWFHAHAGGRTATAEEGLSYQKDAPYTQSIESVESDRAPQEDAAWEAEFTAQQVIAAAADCGVSLGETLESAEPGAKGNSGRLKTLRLNGSEVPANEFRIAIGSSELKSTLITGMTLEDQMLRVSGKGYGHGVGMSQWGAYALAEQGRNAAEIINMYFKDVDIVQIYN